MNLFSQTFLTVLIHGALLWTTAGVLLLLALLIRDFIRNNIW
jgi:hypothetical protein